MDGLVAVHGAARRPSASPRRSGRRWCAGRERPRVYLALLLLLESALVLLFTAQELVLFYVGWEVMMIPLYVLMGVWGGESRRRATIQFVVYTLVGSLLMLVAIAVLGVSAPHLRALRADRAPARVDLALPRLRGRVLHQGAAVPAARLAAERLPRVDARGDGAALRRDLEGRRVRPAASSPSRSSRRSPTTGAGCSSVSAWPASCTARSSPSASRTRAASSPTPASAR